MTFVILSDGKCSVPLSEVKFVEEARGELVRLTMKDGSHFETYSFQWEASTKHQFQQVVPAAPGTLLICINENDEYAPETFEPVIGWGVHTAGGVLPLTHYGTPDDYSPHVLHPDGKVTNSGGGVFESLEKYLECLAEAKVEALAAA